jgi:anti-sigma B factor antagonist
MNGDIEMELVIEELPGDITKLSFDGRFDIAGAQDVDLKVNVIAGSRKRLLFDMQKVSFLGSMGLRTILTAARAVKNRGGKMAIFVPDDGIEKVIATSGVGALLSIHRDFQSAISALQQ